MNAGKSCMDAVEQSGKGESAGGLVGNELQLTLQVSVVGLIREEWLAGRVESNWGRGMRGRMKLWQSNLSLPSKKPLMSQLKLVKCFPLTYKSEEERPLLVFVKCENRTSNVQYFYKPFVFLLLKQISSKNVNLSVFKLERNFFEGHFYIDISYLNAVGLVCLHFLLQLYCKLWITFETLYFNRTFGHTKSTKCIKHADDQ